MSYTPTTWVNGQPPALNAENLNKIEQGIVKLDEDVDDVKKDLSEITEVVTSHNLLNPSEDESGYYRLTNGTKDRDSGYHRTPNGIMIPNGTEFINVISRTTFPANFNILFYADETTDNYIMQVGISRGLSISSISIPSNARYFRLSAVNTIVFADVSVQVREYTTFEEYAEAVYINPSAIIDKSITHEKLSDNLNHAIFKDLNGKTIVNLGDSIFGNFFEPNDISSFIAEFTNAIVYNCGFGGCRMAKHNINKWDAFCMHSLADAIHDNDWSLQDSLCDDASWTDRPWYFRKRVNYLKSIDFSKVDIITIAYGTNDFMSDIKQDNELNKYDIEYYKGSLRYSIEKILSAYPNIRIIVCTPIYRSWNNADGTFKEDSNTKIDSWRKTLIDFGTSCKEVCAEYNLQCIDNYYIGMGKFTRTYYWDTTDYTHPNVKGLKLIARHISHELY